MIKLGSPARGVGLSSQPDRPTTLYKWPMELFLSHATSDAAIVGEIRWRLAAVGVDIYTAEHDVRAVGRLPTLALVARG
jgi:hypothetical protein